MPSQPAELKFWFETTFQNQIQVSLQLSKQSCPQQTPYLNKYKSIQTLKSLLSTQQNYKFIVYCLLGQLYSDVQQTNDSVKAYMSSLAYLAKLPIHQVNSFYQYFIITYNMLGLSFINREQNQEGLGCLCKAYQIYQAYFESKGTDTYHNRSYKSNGRQFNFYYQGGNDFQNIQSHHTLTLFYMAQGFTKVGLKSKAAQYCGLTLQRQYASQKFQLNQFCHNLIGLSQYYSGNRLYAQAQYILLLALRVLPQGKKQKMRALVQIQLGKVIGDMLEYCVERIRTKDFITLNENQVINQKFLIFQQFQQKFPEIPLINDLEACKSLFRKSNTLFKKAAQVFVLDGFVTQHVDILFEQSKLYRSLSILETSRQRVFNMLQKRREHLQPLLSQLNPKAFFGTWQRILIQVSQIYNDLFNMKYLLVVDVKTPASQPKLQQYNKLGFKLIYYYQQIIKVMQADKDAQKNQVFFRSLINSRFNIARTQSRLLSHDKFIRVKFLSQSYKHYKELYTYINQGIDANLRHLFSKELSLTNDMVQMMPNKIDKINYGMVGTLD